MITSAQAEMLAGRVRIARVQRLWTQQQLADASGVSRATIARIEANRLIPHMRSVAAIARAMEVDPRELLGDVRPAQSPISHVAPGEVHDRMPACITPDGYDDWLGGHLDVDALMQLLDRESYAVAHELEHYKVSRDVNSVRNNGPHLLDPLP